MECKWQAYYCKSGEVLFYHNAITGEYKYPQIQSCRLKEHQVFGEPERQLVVGSSNEMQCRVCQPLVAEACSLAEAGGRQTVSLATPTSPTMEGVPTNGFKVEMCEGYPMAVSIADDCCLTEAGGRQTMSLTTPTSPTMEGVPTNGFKVEMCEGYPFAVSIAEACCLAEAGGRQTVSLTTPTSPTMEGVPTNGFKVEICEGYPLAVSIAEACCLAEDGGCHSITAPSNISVCEEPTVDFKVEVSERHTIIGVIADSCCLATDGGRQTLSPTAPSNISTGGEPTCKLQPATSEGQSFLQAAEKCSTDNASRNSNLQVATCKSQPATSEGEPFLQADVDSAPPQELSPVRKKTRTVTRRNRKQAATTCKHCNTHFTNQETFAKHFLTHFEAFQCDECGECFASRYFFNQHVEIHRTDKHSDEKPFKCNFCGLRMTLRGNLQAHIKRRHQSESKPIEIATTIRDSPREECKFCDKSFMRYRDLKYHLETHHREKIPENEKGRPFKCNICPVSFYHETKLKAHFQSKHKLLLPKKQSSGTLSKFECRICCKGHARQADLTHHVRMQHAATYQPPEKIPDLKETSRKPLKCEQCGKCFKYPSHYTRHLAGHSGRKVFLCVPCKKSYSRYEHLVRHYDSQSHRMIVDSSSTSAKSSAQSSTKSLSKAPSPTSSSSSLTLSSKSLPQTPSSISSTSSTSTLSTLSLAPSSSKPSSSKSSSKSSSTSSPTSSTSSKSSPITSSSSTSSTSSSSTSSTSSSSSSTSSPSSSTSSTSSSLPSSSTKSPARVNPPQTKKRKTIITTFLCEKCFETFPRAEQLEKHLLSVHNHRECDAADLILDKGATEKPFKCKNCSLTCQHYCNFMKHLERSQVSRRLIRCKRCRRRFGKAKDLAKHICCSSVVKEQFECPLCGQRFYVQESLKVHVQYHHR